MEYSSSALTLLLTLQFVFMHVLGNAAAAYQTLLTIMLLYVSYVCNLLSCMSLGSTTAVY